MEDLFGLGKVLPIDKLVSIASNALGKLFRPYFDRRDIDTKAYEIKKFAEANAEGMKTIAKAVHDTYQLTGGIEYKEGGMSIMSPKDLPSEQKEPGLVTIPIEERAQERLSYQEAKRQLNVESITSFAAQELVNESPVTDEPLDDDWINRFFRMAEDVSSEAMQMLWGKILAGEIRDPQSGAFHGFVCKILPLWIKSDDKRRVHKFGRV